MKRWRLSSCRKAAHADSGVPPWGKARGLSGAPSQGGISTHTRLVCPRGPRAWSAGRRALAERLPERGQAWEPVSHSALAQSPRGSWANKQTLLKGSPPVSEWLPVSSCKRLVTAPGPLLLLAWRNYSDPGAGWLSGVQAFLVSLEQRP